MPITKLGMDEEIKRLIKTDKEFRRLYQELEANGGASHEGINEIYKKRFGRDWPGYSQTRAGGAGAGGGAGGGGGGAGGGYDYTAGPNPGRFARFKNWLNTTWPGLGTREMGKAGLYGLGAYGMHAMASRNSPKDEDFSVRPSREDAATGLRNAALEMSPGEGVGMVAKDFGRSLLGALSGASAGAGATMFLRKPQYARPLITAGALLGSSLSSYSAFKDNWRGRGIDPAFFGKHRFTPAAARRYLAAKYSPEAQAA